MGVTISDATIRAMDEQLTALVPSDLACGLDGIALGRMQGGISLITFSTDCPSTTSRNDVLITSRQNSEFPSLRS